MNKLKGIFKMSSISKYLGRFGFSLTRSFRYVKRILVLKKKSFQKFSCHSQKNTNRTQVFLLRLSFSLETFIPTELLVMPQMPHSVCCIHPWWYYFIKFQRNYKMMEKEPCSSKYFRYNWMNLIATHAFQQLDKD